MIATSSMHLRGTVDMHTLKSRLLFAVPAIVFAFLQACGGGGGGNSTPLPVVTDINSAATASGPSGSSFVVDGSAFGTLSGSGMTSGYSVDFRDATTHAVLATASYVGTGWNDVYIKAVVPSSGLTVGTTYEVTVTTPGGTSSGVNFLVTASVALSPSTIAWAETTALPEAIQGFPTVIANISETSGGVTTTTSHIYTLGGNTAPSGTSGGRNASATTIFSNALNDGTNNTTAGTLAGAWAIEANSLPGARAFSAGAIANGFNSPVTGNGTIFVLGGLDAMGAATATVYEASLDAAGSVGAWTEATALPDARYAFGAVVFRGRLYVAGGNDATDTPVATVYSAPINGDGTLGMWSALPDLPVPVAYHRLVTTGGVLYVLGGTLSAAVDPISATQSAGTVNTVYYNAIKPDGTLEGTSWSTNPSSMIKAMEKNTVVAIGSYVLVSGGLYNSASTGSSEESYSTQSASDATLTSFQGATGSKTISGTTGGYAFFNHSAALYVDPAGNPHVLILGGQTVAATPVLQSGVWYMQ